MSIYTVHVYPYISITQSIYLSILSIYLSIYLFIYLFVYLPTCLLSIYLFNYLSIFYLRSIYLIEFIWCLDLSFLHSMLRLFSSCFFFIPFLRKHNFHLSLQMGLYETRVEYRGMLAVLQVYGRQF